MAQSIEEQSGASLCTISSVYLNAPIDVTIEIIRAPHRLSSAGLSISCHNRVGLLYPMIV